MMEAPRSLKIDGEVAHSLDLKLDDLAALPVEAQIPDVSRLDPKRRGKAVKLSAVLDLAGVRPGAAYLTLHASADDFHASVPLDSVRERGILIYEVDGGLLPASAGGPFRFYIPDFAACHSAEVDECANVKFVDRLELTVAKGHDNRPEDEKQHAQLHQKPSD
jgi:DMSO/TMAO reductase YedYZ molybdopterin-dependent catalytic subunit